MVKVKNQSENDVLYEVNTSIGVCTCSKGADGSPCSHQAAVVLKYGDVSCNTITTLSALARMNIAKLALGKAASEDLSFYTSVHQKALQAKYGSEEESVLPLEEVQPTILDQDVSTNDADDISDDDFKPSFSGSAWDLVRASIEEVRRENQAEDDVVDEYAGAYLNPGPHGPGPYHQTVQIIIFIINCYYIHVCAHNKNQNLVYHRVHSAAVQLIHSTSLPSCYHE